MVNTHTPEYRECFVAFIDILGFKSLIKNSKEPFDNIKEGLEFLANLLGSGHNNREKDLSIFTQIRVFSDNIVIFRPCDSDSFGFFLKTVSDISTNLFLRDLPVRGGMSIGKMHWNPAWFDDNETEELNIIKKVKKMTGNGQSLVFGEGLISAYELENEVAIYPRTIISDKLYLYLKERQDDMNLSKSFSLTKPSIHMKVLDFIKKDFDGVYFFDFLHEKITFANYQLPKYIDGKIINQSKVLEYDYVINLIEALTENNLKSAKSEKIRMKYEWLFNYIKSKKK